MILIKDEIFNQAGSKRDLSANYVNMDLLNDPDINTALKKYVLLTNFAGDFANENALNIYYNRYYWYMKFRFDYVAKYGRDDLNLAQEAFQILESGDQFENIDWVEIQKIEERWKL